MSKRSDHLFVRSTVNPARRTRLASLDLPTHRLVIYFTPRSGSSWLTDLIVQSRRLGSGNEIFNPNFIPKIATGIQALDKADYLGQVQRRFRSANGRFSFEITAHQLDLLFPDPSEFMDVFNTGTCRSVWLIRQDIVAQAVSLAKMVETGVSHSPHVTDEARAAAERNFRYDPEQIQRWMLHIRAAERRSEELFASFAIEPVRLSYEDMMLAGAEAVRARIAALLDVPLRGLPALNPAHEKLGTAQNDGFAAQFRRDAPEIVTRLEAERLPLLRALSPLAPVRRKPPPA